MVVQSPLVHIGLSVRTAPNSLFVGFLSVFGVSELQRACRYFAVIPINVCKHWLFKKHDLCAVTAVGLANLGSKLTWEVPGCIRLTDRETARVRSAEQLVP